MNKLAETTRAVSSQAKSNQASVPTRKVPMRHVNASDDDLNDARSFLNARSFTFFFGRRSIPNCFSRDTPTDENVHDCLSKDIVCLCLASHMSRSTMTISKWALPCSSLPSVLTLRRLMGLHMTWTRMFRAIVSNLTKTRGVA